MTWFWSGIGRGKDSSLEAEAELDESLQMFLEENRPGPERSAPKIEELAPSKRVAYIQPFETEAALENCALEHEALGQCITHGTWRERLLSCSAKKKAFWRCFDQQKSTLKTLGYGEDDQNATSNEEIKAHADRLYHNAMLKTNETLSTDENR